MAAFTMTSLYLYRWRYIIGYTLIGLVLVGLLLIAGLYLPGGISPAEQASVIKSDSLTFTDFHSFAIVNLPYYILQAVSIDLFGVHDFSIKLPSLILGFLSAVGLIFLLSRWFRRNIAVLASFIAITTGQFLFVSQSGTPSILYIFWPVILLLLGVLVSRSEKHAFIWKVLFFIAAALSLYTPLSIYPLVAMVLAGFLHPHLRNIIRRLSKVRLVFAIIVAFIIVSPLMYGMVTNPSLALTLLGVPAAFPDFMANIVTVGKQYLDFWKPSTTTLMTPVFGLGSMLLIAYGAYRVIRTSNTTQSYLIIAWIICLVPVLLINPGFTSVIFTPLVLILTIGLQSLVRYWYRLFPQNPYARVAGLIPLILLVVALVSSGLDRYVYGYYYQPQTAANFSSDLQILPKDTKQLVVTQDELAFYEVVGHHTKGLVVTTAPTSTNFTTTHNAHKAYQGSQISRVITSKDTTDSDRFYVYTTSDK
jgi:4-amino-4-deoxy-L-arabinose transferase-like glycosyltransferase